MKNIFDLTDKIAVVVGGGGGIGGAIAKGFAFYGAKVVITGRTLSTLEQTAEAIKAETGVQVDCIPADSSDLDSVRGLRDQVVAKYGTVHILVNSQGFNRKFPGIEATDHLDDWDAMYRTNVRGMLLCCTEFAKVMEGQHYGKIINISSIRGARALKFPGNVGYGSTKGAVDAMTKYLAGEWGEKGITVNAIGPIFTKTPMMEESLRLHPETEEQYRKVAPLCRMGEPDDNIGPAVFLASDASGFVTGQIIYPDGGMFCIG